MINVLYIGSVLQYLFLMFLTKVLKTSLWQKCFLWASDLASLLISFIQVKMIDYYICSLNKVSQYFASSFRSTVYEGVSLLSNILFAKAFLSPWRSTFFPHTKIRLLHGTMTDQTLNLTTCRSSLTNSVNKPLIFWICRKVRSE